MSKNQIVKGLEILLADTYSLYLKTQNYHWNVTGPNFSSLHALFEGQYTELAVAIDEVAERIRSLGERAPGSYSEFSKLTKLKEAEARKISSAEMLKDLIKDHDLVLSSLHKLSALAGDEKDQGTTALLDGRISFHEKAKWMLESSL